MGTWLGGGLLGKGLLVAFDPVLPKRTPNMS